ncbi:hypothetical protein [Bradyrhizobium sp. 153]|uniref:hypothetical protein n=1 Tax=Bradyrhizobium sp. 153 TaxID=2782627 RepID=UPI001FF97F71|nr:hypothetical protein [Bradyrhizobium sp. 153]MCK1667763.1 hypothetical protein [Bradyrhizobium sp. 153]
MTVHEDASVPAKAVARSEGVEPNDHLQLFLRQWRWAVATFVIVAVIAIVTLSQIRPQWEAQATIRIGQVYDAFAGSTRLVESLQEVQEWMRVKSFLQEAFEEAGLGSESALVPGVRIDPVPSTGMIRITARAPVADEATRIVTAIFDRLKSVHGELTRAARSEAELLAQQYANELAGLREVQSNLQKAYSSGSNSGADDRSTLESVASAVERNAKEIREIDHQRFLLLRRDKYQTFPTEMMGKISSSRIGRASLGLIIVFGIVMGLAAGLVCAVLRDYVARKQSQLLSD